MKVISVLNQKGGSGKTTIATHLARALQLAGNSVLLVDSDPQGSSRDWAAVHEEQPVPVIGIDRPTIERDLKSVVQKDFVVIDGAPQTADLAISAIKASDLVNLIKQRIELTDGNLKAAFLINRAIKGTKIGGEIRAALEEYELPVLSTVIVQRIIYPTSAITGSTVLDKEPNGEAAKEIQSLTNEVINLLNTGNHI